MSKASPIAGLVLLVVLGALAGRRMNATQEPPPSVAEKDATSDRPPLDETLKRLNRDLGEAESHELELELESRTYAELETAYLKRIQEDPHGLDGRRMLSVMLKMSADATLALVNNYLEGSNRDHEHARLLQEWGKFAPHEALRYATELDKDAFSHHLVPTSIDNFLSAWVTRDPRAALDAWLALPEPKFADPKTESEAAGCLAQGAASDPDMREVTLGMFLAQPPSTARGKAIGGAVMSWAQTAAFEEVTTWISGQNFEGAEANTVAVHAAIGALGGPEDRGATAEWVVAQIYTNQESADERGGHLYEFSRYWANKSTDECARWLERCPPGRETDLALGGLIAELEHRDPASGLQWATQITSDEMRKMWCRKNWDKWRRESPESASNYIAELSSGERKRLGIHP